MVYWPPHCIADSLTELAKLVLEVVLRTPRLIFLGDFNIQTETASLGLKWDLMGSMAIPDSNWDDP